MIRVGYTAHVYYSRHGDYKMQVHLKKKKKGKEGSIHVYQLQPTYPTSLEQIITPALFSEQDFIAFFFF